MSLLPATAQSDLSVVRFSTADYAPRDRLAAWHDIYGRAMCRQDIEPVDAESIHADVVFRKLPGLAIMTGARSPAIYRRDRRQVDSDNLFVTVALSGTFEAAQLGRSVCMEAGDAFVGAGAEPVTARVSSGYRSVTLSVPLAAMAPAMSGLEASFGRRIPAGSPGLRLMTRYLDVVAEAGEAGSPELYRQVAAHVRDLLALALGPNRNGAETARLDGVRAARLREIMRDIEEDPCREDLTVETVAARHRLPVRYLQRLFEAEGVTFTAFVRERRLARVHRLLRNPRHGARPIGVIAYEAGFTNQAYFNRAFRARYGASPSDVRAQGHAGQMNEGRARAGSA
jgi:AraC-like DNA-binding protein